MDDETEVESEVDDETEVESDVEAVVDEEYNTVVVLLCNAVKYAVSTIGASIVSCGFTAPPV